jgi:alcohol dehydrogenase, propanol-preferring
MVHKSPCGVCRTDLRVIDGDLTEPRLPIHHTTKSSVALIALGAGVTDFHLGERVGIPWLGHTCGHCAYCCMGAENLCDAPCFTGYQIDGGMRSWPPRCRLLLPPTRGLRRCFRRAAALCRLNRLGYRALRAHGGRHRAIAQRPTSSLSWPALKVARATPSADPAMRRPRISPTDSAAYGLQPQTAAAHRARLRDHLCARRQPDPSSAELGTQGQHRGTRGIHISDVPAMPYSLLWGERVVRSVANLTRQHAKDFVALDQCCGARAG